MKKIVSVLLVLALAFSFVGCTKKLTISELSGQNQTESIQKPNNYEESKPDNNGVSDYGESEPDANYTQEQEETKPADSTISKQEKPSLLCLHKETTIKNKTAATCTANGNTGDKYCVTCNKLIKKGTVINATGHQTEIRNKKEATTTSEGYTGDTYCKVCNKKISSGEIIPEIDNTVYIEISSADQIYALARILDHPNVKLGMTDRTEYNAHLKKSWGKFKYPEGVTTEKAKREYLQKASYKLTSDIELTIQATGNPSHFTGIGSSHYWFVGTFNGNGKTITLKGSDLELGSNRTKQIGIFAYTSATIKNLNVEICEDLVINSTNGNVYIGGIVGYAEKADIINCNVTINNATMGVDYNADSTYCAYVGGLVGKAVKSNVQNCTVKMNDSTLCAKGPNVDSTTALGMFSVGGIMGFSGAGSNNTDNIGTVGNQILNCKLISNNTSQRDVIAAYVEKGDELTVGGIVGCSFNNMVVKNCSVDIIKGNIVAKKLDETGSTSGEGTQAGGIAGRIEHTCEIYNCNVKGNYLNVSSQSNTTTTAGGIVGFDWGAYHKNIITINKCSFDGNNTSTITAKNGNARVGGIAGRTAYIIADCSVKNVTLVNKTENSKSYAGKIVGYYDKNNSTILSGKYFKPNTPEIRNCTSQNVKYNVLDNIKTGDIYGGVSK